MSLIHLFTFLCSLEIVLGGECYKRITITFKDFQENISEETSDSSVSMCITLGGKAPGINIEKRILQPQSHHLHFSETASFFPPPSISPIYPPAPLAPSVSVLPAV